MLKVKKEPSYLIATLSSLIPLLILITFLIAGCASYRVVELGPGVDDENIVRPFYAVARNNILIPEYVVDSYQNYPYSPEEAETRFESRKNVLETFVREKYELPPSWTYQCPRYLLGAGLTIISPVAIPVQALGECFSRQTSKRSFGEIAADYFEASFNSPMYEKPKIRERVDIFY